MTTAPVAGRSETASAEGSAMTSGTRFHLSLNVSSLSQAVAYYEKVFGQAPAKQRSDYAKFELEFPPVTLSLEENAPARNGSLNHLGFRFADSSALVAVQRRLEQAGITTQREEGVECCYARQTKFWLHDFDQRLWEFYTLDGDIDHRGEGQSLEQMVGLKVLTEASSPDEPAAQPVVWQHRMYEPFSLPDERCDEILLQGTFNVPTTDEQMRDQLAATYTVLNPGGTLTAHILTAEAELSGELHLPGPAAYVKHVPMRQSLMRAIEAAGFEDIQLVTFRSGACFEHQGQPLRETRITAQRPLIDCGATCTVVFKGPFAEIADDAGHVWRRGEPTVIPRSRLEALQKSAVRDLFVELPEQAAVAHCGL